jgi:rhodanese-related sulfurtransferase
MNLRLLLAGAAAGGGLMAGAAILVATALPTMAPWKATPWTLDPTDPRLSLEDVEREVIRRYPVPDISASALAAVLASGAVTLFDVRTQEEYEAGHLPGSIRIEPGSSSAEIIRLHRDRLDDGPVVFYCAVGVRSSRVLMATLEKLAPLARDGIFNLRGGIFRWTADGRALVIGTEAGRPHPFDDSWGQLLARTTPR